MSEYKYKTVKHPLTKDPMWVVTETGDNVISFINKFLDAYEEDYDLSIYDVAKEQSTSLFTCSRKEFAQRVHNLCNSANGHITFIGVNSWANCYVVGIS